MTENAEPPRGHIDRLIAALEAPTSSPGILARDRLAVLLSEWVDIADGDVPQIADPREVAYAILAAGFGDVAQARAERDAALAVIASVTEYLDELDRMESMPATDLCRAVLEAERTIIDNMREIIEAQQ